MKVKNPFYERQKAKREARERKAQQKAHRKELDIPSDIASVVSSGRDLVRETCDICDQGWHYRDRRDGEQPEIRSNRFGMGSPHVGATSTMRGIATTSRMVTVSQRVGTMPMDANLARMIGRPYVLDELDYKDYIVGEEIDQTTGRVRTISQMPDGAIVRSAWYGIGSIEDQRGESVESDPAFD